jgi:hypothetical protein
MHIIKHDLVQEKIITLQKFSRLIRLLKTSLPFSSESVYLNNIFCNIYSNGCNIFHDSLL